MLLYLSDFSEIFRSSVVYQLEAFGKLFHSPFDFFGVFFIATFIVGEKVQRFQRLELHDDILKLFLRPLLRFNFIRRKVQFNESCLGVLICQSQRHLRQITYRISTDI